MIRIILSLGAIAVCTSCADLKSVSSKGTPPAPAAKPKVATVVIEKLKSPWKVKKVQKGEASWYSIRTNGGTQTASGERLKEEASTAAHKTLRMGTKVRVTNLRNGKSEIVKITDRGPFIKGRIIDVTTGVARRIGFHSRGVAPVKVEVLEKREVPGTDS